MDSLGGNGTSQTSCFSFPFTGGARICLSYSQPILHERALQSVESVDRLVKGAETLVSEVGHCVRGKWLQRSCFLTRLLRPRSYRFRGMKSATETVEAEGRLRVKVPGKKGLTAETPNAETEVEVNFAIRLV